MNKPILIKPVMLENHARAVSLGVLGVEDFEGAEAQKTIQVRADEITIERTKTEAEALEVFIKREADFKKTAKKKKK